VEELDSDLVPKWRGAEQICILLIGVGSCFHSILRGHFGENLSIRIHVAFEVWEFGVWIGQCQKYG
jgi:hypothetical protein